MPEVTDPALLAQLNGQEPQGGVRVLSGPKVKETYRLMTPEEIASTEGLDPESAYQISPDGKIDAVGAKKKPIAKWPLKVMNDVTLNNAALKNINATIDWFDPKNDTQEAKDARNAVGFGTGMLGDYFTQWNDPEGTDGRSRVGQVGSIIIKDTSGAAVSLSEDARLRKWVPYVTDTPEVIQDKLKNLKRELTLRNEALVENFNPDTGYIARAVNERGEIGDSVEMADAGASQTLGDIPPEAQARLKGWVEGHRGQQVDKQEFLTFANGILNEFVPGQQIEADKIDDYLASISKGEPVAGFAPGKRDMTTYEKGVNEFMNDDWTGPLGVFLLSGGQAVTFNGLDELSGNQYASDAINQVQDENPWSSLAGSLSGGIAQGALLPGAALATPGRAVASSGALGFLSGFGDGEGGFGNRFKEGTTSGLLSAGLTKYGGKLAEKVFGGGKATPVKDAIGDAAEFGIDLPVGAMNRGGAIVDSILSNQIGSAGTMQGARNVLKEQVTGAVDNVAGKFGPATSFEGMGEAAQKGARKWISKFEETASKAYDGIPISPKAKASLSNSRDAIAALTGKFESNPELAKAFQNNRLETFKRALNKSTSWEDLKAFRSVIGEEIGQGRFGDVTSKKELRSLYGALSKDMEATAAEMGPQALSKFKRANELYKAGQDRIDSSLLAILGDDGKKSAEAAAGVIQRISKEGKSSSDIKKLADIRASMPAEEWGEVSNSLIRLTGQPANSSGRDFAADTFMRNYKDMSDEAKNLLYGDKGRAELKAELDRLSGVIGKLAERDSLRNSSNTAAASMANSTIGGVGGLSLFGPLGILGGMAVQQGGSYGAAKLMTNPKFVRWATGYEKMVQGAAKAGGAPNVAKQKQLLKRLAVTEPAIAIDIMGIHDMLDGKEE
jgi:hypothetical protein